MTVARVRGVYRRPVEDGRSTEALVEAGRFAYAHSCVTSESFPVRPPDPARPLHVVLLSFDGEVAAPEVLSTAAGMGLARPRYEDALYFAIAHPEAQRAGPIVFLHDPWIGFFGRRDVLCLWCNAGRRELGLEGFDDRWRPPTGFAFLGDRSGEAV